MIRCSSASIAGSVSTGRYAASRRSTSSTARWYVSLPPAFSQFSRLSRSTIERGQVQLGRPVGHRVLGHDQVLVGHELVDQRVDRQVLGDPHLAHEAQRLAAHLVVEDELGQVEHEQEVEHPGPLTRCSRPASAAMSADPNVSAPACASRIGPSDSAMYDWQGSSSDLATAT